jgi:hypothetical protein
MRRRPCAVLVSPDVGGFFGNTDIFGGSYADPTTP